MKLTIEEFLHFYNSKDVVFKTDTDKYKIHAFTFPCLVWIINPTIRSLISYENSEF